MAEQYPIVITPEAIARYAWLDKPDEKTAKSQYGDGKYKVTLLFDKPKPGGASPLVKMVEAVAAAARQKWGPNVDLAMIKKPWVDGDTKGKEGFAGKVFITAKTQYQPSQVGPDRQELELNNRIWAGDVVRASVIAFPYEKSEDVPKVVNGQAVMDGGKVVMEKGVTRGVTFQLRAVQLIRKGERIGGDSSHDFDDAGDVVAVTGADNGILNRTVTRPARPAADPHGLF